MGDYFITHASAIIALSVTLLHILGFLAERYLTGGVSAAVWVCVGVIDAAFAYRCGVLVQAAFKDSLTALHNRHYFAAAIAGRTGGGRKSGAGIALLMIDIDDFKHINDRHGHDVGDTVLRQLAALLTASIRKADAAIRWGGEEFLIILADTDKTSAGLFAERLRATVERHRFAHGQDDISVTVSIGIAAAATADLEQLTRLADEALYRAKRTKNTVIL